LRQDVFGVTYSGYQMSLQLKWAAKNIRLLAYRVILSNRRQRLLRNDDDGGAHRSTFRAK